MTLMTEYHFISVRTERMGVLCCNLYGLCCSGDCNKR